MASRREGEKTALPCEVEELELNGDSSKETTTRGIKCVCENRLVRKRPRERILVGAATRKIILCACAWCSEGVGHTASLFIFRDGAAGRERERDAGEVESRSETNAKRGKTGSEKPPTFHGRVDPRPPGRAVVLHGFGFGSGWCSIPLGRSWQSEKRKTRQETDRQWLGFLSFARFVLFDFVVVGAR